MTSPLHALVHPDVEELRAYTPHEVPGAIRLHANESPWPLPAEARRRIEETIASVAFERYPDPTASALRKVLANRWGGDPSGYVVGTGSDEVISILLTALRQPRKKASRPVVLFPTPTFVMYGITGRALGWEICEIPLDERWHLDPRAMMAALKGHHPNIVFLATPNNPTGNSFDRFVIQSLVEEHRDVLFVIDEAYRAYARTERFDTTGQPNVAVLGTVSKLGFAALRVGWVHLPGGLAHEVHKARQPYNVSTLSQSLAALALLEFGGLIEEHAARVVEERQRVEHELGSVPGFHPFPSDANLIWTRYDGNADALAAHLADQGVIIRSFHSAGGRLTGYLRVTIGTPTENTAFLNAVRDLKSPM